ncbi:MAG: pitrilysin family protein [Blastocatellia bacterium]|nr:pitrilysin family protein [Blastocatellia bacterium]
MNIAHRVMRLLLIASLILTSAPVFGQGKKASPGTGTIKVNFQDVRLKNGLRVMLVEDHSAPVVSVAFTFDVGSRNERKGRTGFAHLFEHMMFAGSENVGKNEYSLLIDTNGGQNNATTDQDRTLYFATVPANQLEMILFIEADRIRALDVTRAELDIQRNAVQEERRLGVDNQPYGRMEEEFDEHVYDNFVYKHSVIGSMEDLNAASLEDVKSFFRTYYAPNNAAMALVGDFNAAQAMALIRKYFEVIPSQPAPPKVDVTEPEQTAERRFTIEDPLARLPMVQMAYKGIIANTPDAYAMQVLANVLSTGQSSRLYQKLVKEKELVAQVFGGSSLNRGTGYFSIRAIAAPGKKVEEIEAAIGEELERLKKEPIADWELEKAKNFSRRSSIQRLQSSLGVAFQLTENAIAFNDPGLINTQFARLAAVTKEDVRRVANKYFKNTVRTVGITMPAGRK